MAINFTTAASQSIEVTLSTPISIPCCISCRAVTPAYQTNFAPYVAVVDALPIPGNSVSIRMGNQDPGDLLMAEAFDGASHAAFDLSPPAPSATAYHSLMGRFATATLRQIWVDGVLEGSNLVTDGATGMDIVRVNQFTTNGGDITICEIAIWDADLSVSERNQVFEGFNPRFIRPQDLVLYWPGYVRDDVVIDYSGNENHGTVLGGTQADHAPVSPIWWFGRGNFVPDLAETLELETTIAPDVDVTPNLSEVAGLTSTITPDVDVTPPNVAQAALEDSIDPDVVLTPNLGEARFLEQTIDADLTVTPDATEAQALENTVAPDTLLTPDATEIDQLAQTIAPDLLITPDATVLGALETTVTIDVLLTPDLTIAAEDSLDNLVEADVTVTPDLRAFLALLVSIDPEVTVTPNLTALMALETAVGIDLLVTPDLGLARSLATTIAPEVVLTPDLEIGAETALDNQVLADLGITSDLSVVLALETTVGIDLLLTPNLGAVGLVTVVDLGFQSYIQTEVGRRSYIAPEVGRRSHVN